MAEPEDLLSKADALMARHRPARAGAAPYAEIPVLDEVVDLPPASGDLPSVAEPAGPPFPDGERTEALAANIRASLLAALQPEIDSLIEERLKEGLAPLLESLFGDLQVLARASLSDAIKAAVEQEFERRKAGE